MHQTVKERIFDKIKIPKKYRLTVKEKIIFNSIMRLFPATNPDSAYDHAINGGVKFEHYNR